MMIHCRWHEFCFAFGLFYCVSLNFGNYKSKVISFRGQAAQYSFILMSQINQYVWTDFCLFSVALLNLFLLKHLSLVTGHDTSMNSQKYKGKMRQEA